MDKASIIALVLLGVFANLFIFCFAVSHVRQRLDAKRKHRQWKERYSCKAQQRLDNQRRIWSMYGLEYKGTLDDMRQSDDEDDSDADGDGKSRTLRASRHGQVQRGQGSGSGARESAAAEQTVERGNSSSSGARSEVSPPPYTPGQWGRVGSAPSSPQAPQPPERCRGKDRNMHIEIASPRPQRLARFPLRPPEAVACGVLHRSDTTRSTRRYSEPPVPTVDPKPSPVNGLNTDQGPMAVRSEPPAPMSPRRLDSISRRGWMEAVQEREPHAQ